MRRRSAQPPLLLATLTTASMTLGNLAAFFQHSVRRHIRCMRR